MGYLRWSLIALFAYSLVAPLMKIATEEIPTNVAVMVSNTMLVLAAAALIVTTDESVMAYLTHPRAPYLYVAGIALAVGILAYYKALALGPVSVVTPIFGMFLALSSLVGFLVLGESVTARKGLGLLFAVAAVYLSAGQ
ncbi:EamA family transporter [Halanaeroarchaeum sulfurireducens]|uniref:Putative DMT superfamily transporter n=1 Tax=Halanaeroarchaeum sulfurireducens TaxID=1604004 RepID=A0A0F7PEH1_9EURY|nr:EamA family transporter [Halanaeroarchaeum sulfurireducens]AKH97698.1 putative DMT superfamily transporter [Halanaeroarchaeum sulfurireducens]ALG82093.1 putative DMT superfamily transporter [Halanaeroarchaeum sulfurireducens]